MRVLEINVDDLHSGGVYSLVKNVIINNSTDVKIDIGAIEKFVNNDNVEMLKRYNCDVHYIGYSGSKWIKQIKCYFNLKKLLKNNQYDYVHIHADVANKLLVSALAAKHAGISGIILHSHAAGVDGNNRRAKILFHRVCRKLLCKIGTTFVACSDLAAKWMYPSIDPSKIIIINNGVDLDRFRYNTETRDKIRERLGLMDKIVIGHVGRFAYQKNHEYLLKIMDSVKLSNPMAKLLLVGEGPEEEKIRNLVKEMGLEDDIIFYGTSNSVDELFQAMDIFVLPSHFEGLPIVGVEAQASGLPVLFSSEITREAAITSSAKFIGINNTDINTWVEAINDAIGNDRKDTYYELVSKKFSLRDTINSFLSLYK